MQPNQDFETKLNELHDSGIQTRLEDFHNTEIEDDSSHLWAVSYADFLMVLLSFFVIFFSLNKDKTNDIQETLINKIALKIGDSNDLKDGGIQAREISSQQANSLLATNEYSLPIRSIVNELESEKSLLQIIDSSEDKEIIIDLPDNIFPLNSIYMNKKGKISMARALKILAQHKDSIQLIFVGHSDSKKVYPRLEKAISNNFALSSLRASEALNSAISFGYPKTILFSEGAADNRRKSRSLSIIVKLRRRI